MACFNPLIAYRGRVPNDKTGKFPMVFDSRESDAPDCPVSLPCGRCIGCRLERSRQWAIRCVHEASLYERNCFITLTFDPAHVPKSRSLDKRDFQLFMKRLRKRYGSGVRYFHCGEYGEECANCGFNKLICSRVCRSWVSSIGRPHYHACLFNFDFPDRELFSCRGGVRLDISPSLQELWPFGFSTVGEVTFESAAYVARYITKKITGDSAASHYERFDRGDGEVFNVLPEYVTMSRRPGIGRPWLDKFMSDVFPHDRVVLRGREMRPPKYYSSVFELAFPEKFDDIKESRRCKMIAASGDNTYERLRVRERCQELRLKSLKRGYEDEI